MNTQKKHQIEECKKPQWASRIDVYQKSLAQREDACARLFIHEQKVCGDDNHEIDIEEMNPEKVNDAPFHEYK